MPGSTIVNSVSRMPEAHDKLQEHLRSLETPSDSVAHAQVEDVLQEVQFLERRQCTNSRFRRLARCLEPLVDFLIMYSPPVDMIVQYDVSPSALVWGSLKTLIKNSIKHYSFIERMLKKLADVLSISARYEKMFEQEQRVQTALTDLYLEVLLFLQRIRASISTGSLKVLARSIFRSVDVEFQDNVQRLSRMSKVFKEEVTFAHRQHIEDHLKEQRFENSALDRRAVKSEQKLIRHSEHGVQEAIETRSSVMVWLGQIDCSEALRRAAKKRSPNTGLWLFNEPLFRSWIQDSDSCPGFRVLWVHGAPGAGKTVLSSTTIEHIQARQVAATAKHYNVAYFYGDSTDRSKGTVFNICISALSQLLAQLREIPKAVLAGHRNARCHGRYRVSEADNVFGLFREVVAALPSVSLIIDALDECSGISEITSWLDDAVRSLPSFHVMYFSRDTAAVLKELDQQPSIRMDTASTKQDVDIYLASAVCTLPCTESELKNRVFQTLSRKAEGMFLFTDLSIQTLRSAINVDDMVNILHTIPDGINEMYGLILKRLSTESFKRRSLARRVFSLICASMRPMTWSEMCFALSWDANQEKFQKSMEPFKDTVLELCCPLIEYQTETDTFRLVHFSVYEYLCENPLFSLSKDEITQFFVQQSDAQHELAVMTLACIADDEVSQSAYLDITCHPLVGYATMNWCYHLSQSPFREDVLGRYLKFVECPERRLTWLLRWLLSEEWSFPLQHVVKLQKLAQQWISQGVEEQPSMTGILGDIQRALFRLDDIQSTPQPSNATVEFRAISNFERLTCVRDLAREYTMAGEIDNGVEMFELALAKAEGSDGDATLRSCWLLNSLGILYDQQGKTCLAKETQSRALALQEQSLPPIHLDTILTINELGRIARHLGQFGEAESLHRRALCVLEKMFPESDLHITWTKSALGRSLLKQSRPDEAIDLHQQVLAIETSRLGRDHPHTLWTLSDIARCYCAQDNIEDAISTQQEVMERSKDALGPENPDTLWATNSLAILYTRSGRLDIARSLHTKALEGQTKILGENHAHTQWSREALTRLNSIEGDCRGRLVSS